MMALITPAKGRPLLPRYDDNDDDDDNGEDEEATYNIRFVRETLSNFRITPEAT